MFLAEFYKFTSLKLAVVIQPFWDDSPWTIIPVTENHVIGLKFIQVHPGSCGPDGPGRDLSSAGAHFFHPTASKTIDRVDDSSEAPSKTDQHSTKRYTFSMRSSGKPFNSGWVQLSNLRCLAATMVSSLVHRSPALQEAFRTQERGNSYAGSWSLVVFFR